MDEIYLNFNESSDININSNRSEFNIFIDNVVEIMCRFHSNINPIFNKATAIGVRYLINGNVELLDLRVLLDKDLNIYGLDLRQLIYESEVFNNG